MHIGAKKEASKRPWVAGFVYLGRFRRSACPSLRRIGAVTCQRKQADEISENAHMWRWRDRETAVDWRFPVALLHLRLRPSDAALPLLLMGISSLCRDSAVRGGREDSWPCASPRRCSAVMHTPLCFVKSCRCNRERKAREKEHRPPSSASRFVRSLRDVRGEERGGKARSRREERAGKHTKLVKKE